MAEFPILTIKADLQGFRDIQDSSRQTADTVQKSTQRMISTYDLFEKSIAVFSEQIINADNQHSIFINNTIENTKKLAQQNQFLLNPRSNSTGAPKGLQLSAILTGMAAGGGIGLAIGGPFGAPIGGLIGGGAAFLIGDEIEKSEEAAKGHAVAIQNANERTIELTQSISELINIAGEEAVFFGFTKEELTKMNEATDAATEAKKKLGDDGVKPVSEKVSNYDNNLQNLQSTNTKIVKSEDQVMKSVEDAGDAMGGAQEQTKEFAEETQQASEVLTVLGVFAADVAANINDAFSDLIFNSMKGNFDSLGDLWENTLDSMLQALSQFLATIISNPIRLSLEGFLTGGSSGGGGGVGGVLGNLGGLGGSFKSLGSLFGIGGASAVTASTFGSAAAGGLAVGAAVPGISPSLAAGILAGGGSIPTTAGAGFLSTLGSAIPAIGAVVAALGAAIPIISNLLKKSPRLDLDFDQLRDDAGKSLGTAAQVFQFLDEDVFNNEIFSRSVSRKAGLGLGSELPNVIREAIEGQINLIQGIINQLPSELAAQLNDSLLNTAVDIESTIKGDRLLEFDETKKIAEKFQQFIEGDLQARFTFAIRDFFVGAFESLGVLGDSAQSFVDQQFEEFQNLSGREARAEVVSLEEVRNGKISDIGSSDREYRLAV